MEIRKQEISFVHYDALAEMPHRELQLVVAAREAIRSAYAPYSGFRVGAAALLDDGQVVCASNQESEVFPSGMCAERVLLYDLQAHAGARRVEAIAIASDPGEHECTPCGACRQVLCDTQKRQGAPIRVIMSSERSATVAASAMDLLPMVFEM